MPDAWDTSVLSRMDAKGRHARLLATHLRTRTPVPLPAPAVQEMARGLELSIRHGAHATARLRWFAGFLADPLAEVIAFDRHASMVAGRLLAVVPHPPTGRRRREGTRAQQRAAWALDVQIAACAFAGGYGVLTENVRDFAALRDAIARLVPGVPPLVVTDARALAAAAA